MVIAAVVGANWGDEGKGRIVDALASEFDYVVRYQGGGNAGHTVINDYGRFVLHLVPSGVFHSRVTNVLGPGVALDLERLGEELALLRERGVPEPKVVVSNRAGLLLPLHRRADALEERRLGAAAFGSTQSGIAPHYADRHEKRGVQVDDLFEPARFEQRIARMLELTNVRFEHAYGEPSLDAAVVAAEQLGHRAWVEPMVCDTTKLLHEAWRGGRDVLFEGQLGALRDPDLGTYPYTTSCSPLASFALVGTGLPARALTRVIAVSKAYASCVGQGPFVTELDGPDSDDLRARGGDRGEYGATTGRPRRVGWFDAVATRYGCRVQGATELALTCLDVLGYLERIPICVAYDAAGTRIDEFPTTRVLERSRPIYEWMPGWRCDVSGARSFADLPAAAQRYVERIESLVELPVHSISVSPRREGLIARTS